MVIKNSSVSSEDEKPKDDDAAKKNTVKSSEPAVSSPGLKLSLENYDSGLNDEVTTVLNEKND